MMTLLEKFTTSDNNPEKLSTVKINEYTSSGYSLFTQCSFDKTKNKLDCYRGKQLEKDHSMIETRRLKNVVIFVQTIL